MKPSWFGFGLAVFFAFILGNFVGIRVYQQGQPSQVATVAQANTVIASWRNEAQKCEANFQTATILYEPGAPPSIPLMNGLVAITPGPQLGDSGPLGARWIVPAKVTPRMTTGEQGFEYYYLDMKTEKFDGPYLPGPIQTGDRFLLGQLTSQ